MNEEKRSFTSRMSRGETAAALLYLPVHVAILPFLLGLIVAFGLLNLSDATFNLLYYVIGLVYMLLLERKFLRREFDALCDHKLDCFVEVLTHYGLMLLANFIVGIVLMFVLPEGENPNNAAVIDMAGTDLGSISVMAVLLAPIVEELMFRAGLFSLIRSRPLAWAVSIVLFSVYHVWSYALESPVYWIYILQYIPSSILLCRCYERTNSIWGSIALHMLLNGGSLGIISSLEGLF